MKLHAVKQGTVIHCPTIELSNKVLEQLEKQEVTWRTGTPIRNTTHGMRHGHAENHCFFLGLDNRLEYGPLGYYRGHDYPEPIHAEQWLKQQGRKAPMNQKTIHEAALEALALEPGDQVRVLFKVPGYTGGWNKSWARPMDGMVGFVFPVVSVAYDGGGVVLGRSPDDKSHYLFPAFCLEVVERRPKVPEYPRTFQGHQVLYRPDHNVLRVGCQEFTLEAILHIQTDMFDMAENVEVLPHIIQVRKESMAYEALVQFLRDLEPLIRYMKERGDTR